MLHNINKVIVLLKHVQLLNKNYESSQIKKWKRNWI